MIRLINNISFLSEQRERLKILLKPSKRLCVRKEKKCHICGKVLIGTFSLKRHLKNICEPNNKNNGDTHTVFIQGQSHPKWKNAILQRYQSI